MTSCEQCRFFYAYPPPVPPRKVVFGGEVVGSGECRRHPPSLEGACGFARFPLVACDWWCGHFEPQAAAPPSARAVHPALVTEAPGRLDLGPSRTCSAEVSVDTGAPECTPAVDRHNANCLKVVQKLREAPDGRLLHSVLLKRMKTDAKSLRDLVATLEQRRAIQRVPVATAGRTGHVYQLLRN